MTAQQIVFAVALAAYVALIVGFVAVIVGAS